MARLKEGWFRRRVHVWGTGYMEEYPAHSSRHCYHAVRGKLTAKTISNLPSRIPLGDPGLLADQLIGDVSTIPKEYRYGILPHYRDREDAQLKLIEQRHGTEATILDIFTEPIALLKQIAGCEVLLSSAMHGIIAADSLGIPNGWLKLSDRLRGGDFKFQDYYSVFGLSAEPFVVQDHEGRLPSIESIQDRAERPGVASIKQGLIDSFPSDC